MKNIKIFSVVWAMLLLLGACTGGEVELTGNGGECLVNAQCGEGQSCVAGECVGQEADINGEDITEDTTGDVKEEVTEEVKPDLPTCVPSDEVCDGIDNDCDGETDEELGKLTCGVGACAAEVDACVDGQPGTCVAGTPTDEVCDGIDNDCDGETDEELGTTTCGIGLCIITVDNCVGGQPQNCVPGEPEDEICDGLDNDCDESIDEELEPITCGVGFCARSVEACVEGVPPECVPGQPETEVCDAVDNDCDSEVDEDLGTSACGVGACAVVVNNCQDGVPQQCVPGMPSDEVCDGIDNDCDESVDEELADINCGVGECAASVVACVEGVPQECVPGLPSDEICDGLDNDCDESIDEELGTTACGVGECATVMDNCANGQPQQCVPGQPSEEICDGLDNDCDESIDEELGIITCGVGECAASVVACVEGVPQECVPGLPTDEICDGLDNDCSGAADDVYECVTVYGFILDELGQPVPDALVSLHRGEGECAGDNVVDGTMSDENGWYIFYVEREGDYCIDAVPVEFPPAQSEPFFADVTRRIDITVVSDESPMASICGVVFVRDMDQVSPTIDALVRYFIAYYDEYFIEGDTSTASDGTYCYQTMLIDMDYIETVASQIGATYDEKATYNEDFVVNGGTTTIVDFYLDMCYSTVCFNLVTYDAEGNQIPVIDASVVLYVNWDFDGYWETTTSDENGRACFGCVISPDSEFGYYYAEVSVSGKGVYPLSVWTESGMEEPPFTVSQTSATESTLELEPEFPYGVCGTVTDSVTGLPLVGASVQVAIEDTTNVVASTNTGLFGEYCLLNINSRGSDYFLTARFPGYSAMTLLDTDGDFEFVLAQEITVDFPLMPWNASVCFGDDFEVDTGFWTASGSGLVSWYRRENGLLLNAAIPECVALIPAEQCLPGETGCPLCQGVSDPGCIPAPGAVPNSWDGQYAWWMGNPATGNYLEALDSCGEDNGGGGYTADASLRSSYFLVPPIGTTILQFRSWWEIEGVDAAGPEGFDTMLVIVDTGDDSQLLGWMNPSIDYDAQQNESCSSSGLMSPPLWALYEFDLTPYAGQTIRLNFSFDTNDDAYNGFRGWGIDSVAVIGEACGL